MPTLTARAQYIDQGESIDAYQILGPGGKILCGQTIQNLTYGSKTAGDNLTATAGGGQTNGLPLTSINRFTTVANANESATLPPSQPGMSVVVINDAAANAMNIFPVLGDKIDTGAANAAKSLIAGNGTGTPLVFYATAVGQWRTK